jgi:CheY-like chemotaxis protein
MATLAMTELATTDVTRSGDFHGNQVMRQPAVTRNTPSESNRVGADARVLNVLVVDAEQEDSANSLVRQVRYRGHAAHAALDGFAALRESAARHLDVVLLDMETSLMDGGWVAERLRSDYLSEDCLIVAVTERADDARRKQCMEAGIDLVLIKPVDPEVIETLLMLECVRVNRRRKREAVSKLNRLTSTEHRPICIRSKPC